ncbi:ATP-binding protein [Oleidesulfovibrio sp.]|uniref:HAMP domain-containing sensor histidine kinase n=1 Tax=Oleidesulfovibrio sp. TaxID=2909707 RepID=UPI003A8472EB
MLFIAIFPPFLYISDLLREDVITESKLRARNGLEMAVWLMEDRAPFASRKAMNDWAQKFGQRTGMRLTFIEKGKVMADSDVPFAEIADMDDHGRRPEVLAAIKGGEGMEIRYSTTLGKDLIYMARPIKWPDAGLDGVVRIALPASIVNERLAGLKEGMGAVFLIALFASMLLGYFVTRSLARSIEGVASIAQAIGQGEYHRRIREYPGSELRPLVDAINDMATNIQSQMQVLTDQKGRLEAILNAITDGVMVLNEEGRIQSVNAALTEMFPQGEAMLGTTPLEATMQLNLQRAVEAMLRSDDAEPAGNRICNIEMEGGKCIEITLVPFTDPAGARKIVLAFHDISEREQLEKVRRDFVANVSHELKTPLTSIKGYAEMLIDAPPARKEQSEKFLGTILKNANHMIKMVNSLLVLARSQHKREQVAMSAVDVTPVLRQTIREMGLHAEAKQIVIDSLLPEAPLTVLGDKDALFEVFHNLLDNAIKYSPEHSKIIVTGRQSEGRVAICIKDTGPGIPAVSKERIFERFYRLDRDGDQNKSGSAGLGLAICRRIVKSHGGEIWVESPLDAASGTGAAFFVTLDAAE